MLSNLSHDLDVSLAYSIDREVGGAGPDLVARVSGLGWTPRPRPWPRILPCGRGHLLLFGEQCRQHRAAFCGSRHVRAPCVAADKSRRGNQNALKHGSYTSENAGSCRHMRWLFRAARCEVVPGVRGANAGDHLPDRFDHQFRLILVDVVATVLGHEEARVRDERRHVLVRRTQD
jgi:hypothetical protein